MFELDIIDYAAAHGFSFEIASKAVAVYRDEKSDDQAAHWESRGQAALLEAVRSAETPRSAERMPWE